MSEFFEDIGKAFKRAAGAVSTEVSAAAQEQRIKEAYEALGRMYYEATKAGKKPSKEALERHISRLDELTEKLRELRQDQKNDD